MIDVDGQLWPWYMIASKIIESFGSGDGINAAQDPELDFYEGRTGSCHINSKGGWLTPS